jgi:hypothetical protein
MEVDQKAGLLVSEPKVRQQLRVIHRRQFLYGLAFHDDSAFHEHIDAIRGLDDSTTVLNPGPSTECTVIAASMTARVISLRGDSVMGMQHVTPVRHPRVICQQLPKAFHRGGRGGYAEGTS